MVFDDLQLFAKTRMFFFFKTKVSQCRPFYIYLSSDHVKFKVKFNHLFLQGRKWSVNDKLVRSVIVENIAGRVLSFTS